MNFIFNFIFIMNIIFLIKPFFQHDHDKNLNILRTKKACKMK